MLPGELSLAREGIAAVALTLQAGGAVLVATLVVVRFLPHDALLRATAGALLFLVQAAGIPLLLGMVGLLAAGPVLVVHALLIVVAVVLLRRPPRPVDDAPAASAGWSIAAVAAIALAAAYLCVGVAFSVTGGRSAEFDTREYHIANLSSWLQEGDLWHLPYSPPGSITATHPGDGELVALWLALPTHGDELSYLMPTLFAVLGLLGVSLLARELSADDGGRERAGLAALALLALLLTPAYFATQQDSLHTDLAASAGVVAGAGLLLAGRRHGRVALFLAGCAFGLGVGAKYTALLTGALLVVAGLALLHRRRREWWWLAPGLLLLAGPWFVRNLVQTGNPLFPLDLGPFRGSRSPFDVLGTSLAEHIIDGRGEVLRGAGRVAIDGLGPALALVALGALTGALASRRRRGVVDDERADRVDRRLAAGLVTVVVVVAFGGYLATPFTGGGPTGLSFIVSTCLRYAMPGLVVGVALLAGTAPVRLVGAAVALALGWDAWHIVGTPMPGRADLELAPRWAALAALLAIVVAVALGALAGQRDPLLERARGLAADRRVAAAGLAVVVLLAVSGGTVVLHHTDRAEQTGPLEEILLAFGEREPVVVTGIDDLRALIGPRLHRPLVRVSNGGAADELPFADAAQVRRRYLGDTAAPPPPPGLAPALDAAIDRTGARLLVIGQDWPLGYPDGWRPDDGWCVVGGVPGVGVFARPALLPSGTACTTAVDLGEGPSR